MSHATGQIHITATALEPLVHGAGNEGNTQVLRTQEIVTPSGAIARVPFISGNSLKHMIRASGAAYALDVMRVPDGSLDKRVVDLLFSGGHLSKGGAAVDVGAARRLGALFPILPVCGYSAGNRMVASKISVAHLQLVCRENAWRVPASVQVTTAPMLALASASYRDEEFGTRHEATREPRVARMLTTEARLALDGKATDALGKKGAPDKAADSSQMIFEFQTIKAGAVFWGRVGFAGLTPLEMSALRAALAYACQGREGTGYLFDVGAKNAQGFGRMRWDVSGDMRLDAPTWEPTDGAGIVADGVDPDVELYRAHLSDRREEILAALHEAVS